MKYAAAYIRVSDDRQDEYSPDSQLKLIREYAGRNGYCVPDEYVFYDATVIIGLKQNPTHGRRFSPIFLRKRAFCGAKRKMLL